MKWLLLVVLYLPSGETTYNKKEFENLEDCQRMRVKIQMDVFKVNPFARVESECQSIINR